MTQAASSSSSAAKRPRQEDDIRAECPFTVRTVDPREKDTKVKNKKRRKRGHSSGNGNGIHPDDDDATRKVLHQCVPFEPKGSFETHSTMDVHYAVQPARQWADMTRYNSFVLNGIKYYCEGFIYVANESSIERQKSASTTRATTAEGTSGPPSGSAVGAVPGSQRQRSEDDWVARILEIRARDEHHVYARIFWMYWPDELPAGTHYGKKQVQGRQPYHGASELIASNHMDIINVVSVTSLASVNHLNEDKDDDVQSALYWRQALDVRNMELSTIDNVCDCGQPSNPDKMLVGCGNDECRRWLHEECLTHYALMRVFERLGRHKPHVSDKKAVLPSINTAAIIKAESVAEDVKEPLSPRETGGAVSAQHSIDVKAGDTDVEGQEGDASGAEGGEASNGARANGRGAGLGEAVDIAVRNRKRSSEAESDMSSPQLKREMTPSSVGAPGAASTPPLAKGGNAAVGADSKGRRRIPTLWSFGKKTPYDKLFEATLLLTPLESSAPTMIQIHDLRSGISGGEKVWLEPTECPVCGSAIR